MSELPEYILNRAFDAPRDLVWQAWTDPKLLPRWYGPGAETTLHQFELKPGGLWLNEMRWGENAMYARITFQEVLPQEKLVWHDSNADADWNVIPNPRMPDWPRTVSTTVTFEDKGDKTNVRLVWAPHEASEREIACFKAAVDGMGGGWESGYALIDELLKEMKAT